MSLYIRMETGFWTHRKTLRLKARLGEAAFWVVPRLWCYAAENQPDGNFSDYLPGEIAMLVGYDKDSQAMLQALQECGFMDGMTIHGWEERNKYHQSFSDRAKKAADARWGKKRKRDKTREDKRQALLEDAKSNAPSNAPSMNGKARGTLEELKSFVAELGLPASDAEYCFHKWESNGWQNGGKPIKDWRGTIRSHKAAGYLPSSKQRSSRYDAPKASSMPSIEEAINGSR